MRSVYKPTALRNPKPVKRAALIGIILGASVISLWLLLAWLGKTESNYRQPKPGVRYGMPNEIKQTNSTPRVYQPTRFADGELSTYKIKLFALPIGKCTFSAKLVDQNSTPQWHFEMHAGANGLPVKYDARSIVNAAFTHSMPNFETEPPTEPPFKEVTVYHAMPYGLRDNLRKRVMAGLYVDVTEIKRRTVAQRGKKTLCGTLVALGGCRASGYFLVLQPTGDPFLHGVMLQIPSSCHAVAFGNVLPGGEFS